MPQVCCVCKHSTINCKLKRLPANPEKKSRWVANIRREGFTVRDWHRICECHFDEAQFESKRQDNLRKLKPNAIPTIFKTDKPLGSTTVVKAKTRLAEKANLARSTTCETIPTSLNDTTQTRLSLKTEFDEINNENISTPFHENVRNLKNQTITNCGNCSEQLISIAADRDRLQREVYRLKKVITDLKKQQEKLETIDLFKPDQIEHLKTKKVCKWSQETVSEALQVRYKCGIHGYNHLLSLGWPYPSYETLCRRIRKNCGINKTVIDLMGAEFASLSDHTQYCKLSIDEMELSPKLEYDKEFHPQTTEALKGSIQQGVDRIPLVIAVQCNANDFKMAEGMCAS